MAKSLVLQSLGILLTNRSLTSRPPPGLPDHLARSTALRSLSPLEVQRNGACGGQDDWTCKAERLKKGAWTIPKVPFGYTYLKFDSCSYLKYVKIWYRTFRYEATLFYCKFFIVWWIGCQLLKYLIRLMHNLTDKVCGNSSTTCTTVANIINGLRLYFTTLVLYWLEGCL